MTKQEIKPGIYRHYKGKDYQVIGIAQHSETLETLVVYKPLSNDSGLWVRPFSMFTENVNIDGNDMPRFRLLDKTY